MKRGELIRELTELRDKADRLITALQEPTPSARVVGDASSATPSRSDSAPEPAPAEPFFGRLLIAKYDGTCVVCGEKIFQGASILYNKALRRSAHPRCGTEESR